MLVRMSEHPPELPFTGERFTPECVREIWYEHWHRYAFAAPLAAGRRVLDAACGEGYGSALLARTAATVLGVDLDAETVEHARGRYGGRCANLRFERADVCALEHLPAAGFDLIVSFETLEHLREHERLLDGFARLLAEDGLLLISTPDKSRYNALGGEPNQPNPFHLRELERAEFERLLAARFPHYRLYGQKLMFVSALRALEGADSRWQAATECGGELRPGLQLPPLYYLAVCAAEPDALARLPGLSLFADAAESVYAHYNEEVRKHIAAGERLAALERELAELRAALARRADSGA